MQDRTQQLITQVVTWDYFYLILICSNAAYQYNNFIFSIYLQLSTIRTYHKVAKM